LSYVYWTEIQNFFKSEEIQKPIDTTTHEKPPADVSPTLPDNRENEESLDIQPIEKPPSFFEKIWEKIAPFKIELIVLSPVLIFLLWQLWRRYKTQLFLARQRATAPPEIKAFFVKGIGEKFFKSVNLARTAQQLRKHIAVPSHHLDIWATLDKTIEKCGWFTPVTGTMKIRPEYLALIDRTTFNDHQTQLVNMLINQLVDDEVFVTRYYFDNTPHRCYGEKRNSTPLTLSELAHRYPEHRLLIFSDGNGFINPLTCRVARWTEQLSIWSQRVLLTLEMPNQWGYREQLLEAADFLILPANEKGLKILAEYINTETWQLYSDSKSPLAPLFQRGESDSPLYQRGDGGDFGEFPEHLAERPRRWLEHHAPDDSVLIELLRQVHDFLGKDGYFWFSACAIYPELRWQLTLYLGEQLKLLTSEGLARLARLPWFRYGYMPNWLRKSLIDKLSLADEQKIRGVLCELLSQGSKEPVSDFAFEIASPQRKRLWSTGRKNRAQNKAFEDSVFITFMADKLAVKIPRILRAVFETTGISVFHAKMAAIGVLGILLVVGVWQGRFYWQMQQERQALQAIETELNVKLKKLEKLDPSEINKGYVLDQDGQITGLGLEDCGIENLDRIIAPLKGLNKLSTLYLSYNQIQELSALKGLINLSSLDLMDNQIQELSALKGLNKLSTLYLSFNQIQELSALKGLNNLSTLDLRNNQIQELSALKGLNNLSTLNLSVNQIQELSALKGLNNLRELYLMNNQIQELSALKGLNNLQKLYLKNNPLEELPVWITDFDMDIQWNGYSGRGIVLYNNPLKNPPVEIVKQGKEAIRQYFEAQNSEF